jgi:hypothetical protein
MNLRKPKLAKLVDSTKSLALQSVVHDLDVFKEQMQVLLDRHTDLLTAHYEKEKIMERIHSITDIQDLLDFKLSILPSSAMDTVAESIDELFPKEPTFVQVQLYLETLTQLSKGGGDYVREQLRQRIQKLANEQSQAAGRIITPPGIIS